MTRDCLGLSPIPAKRSVKSLWFFFPVYASLWRKRTHSLRKYNWIQIIGLHLYRISVSRQKHFQYMIFFICNLINSCCHNVDNFKDTEYSLYDVWRLVYSLSHTKYNTGSSIGVIENEIPHLCYYVMILDITASTKAPRI